ncbi:hypothetical protein, partial [Burkholderia pseudomallei]|uniref:hypothetical protein n=1 Tax=Burkholderia pseudomallei TaxID=28450 RepID=UPI002AB3D506
RLGAMGGHVTCASDGWCRIGDVAIRRYGETAPPNRQTANHAARRACGCFAALAFAALHAIPNIDHAQPRPRAARS